MVAARNRKRVVSATSTPLTISLPHGDVRIISDPTLRPGEIRLEPHADHLHAEHERLSRTFTSPIPGGTFCESCGHLRHAHVDTFCIAKPIRSKARLVDESVGARCEALAEALRNLIRECVDERQHMFTGPQRALSHAQALLVEAEGWK